MTSLFGTSRAFNEAFALCQSFQGSEKKSINGSLKIALFGYRFEISDKLDTFAIVCFSTCKDLCFALRAKMFQCLFQHWQRQLVEFCPVRKRNATLRLVQALQDPILAY